MEKQRNSNILKKIRRNTVERENFGSRLGFILVSAGCAVGLGNVWKFPYICGENGGAAFILIYLCCLLLLGLPVIICEYALGRGSRRTITKAFDELQPKGSKWSRLKWPGFIGNYVLIMFYTMVAGWMLYYAYLMISGKFVNAGVNEVQHMFSNMLADPVILFFWTAVVIVLSLGVCSLGLKNGVERVTKVMMILLITLMVVLGVRALTLSGAEEGLKFYLVPDFKKMTEYGIGSVVFEAMSHAFFTLSVGMGAMEIFGSYMKKERKLVGEAVSVLCLDTFVALMAGIIILPSCFAYGIKPDAGPSLLFVTLPNVFNHMPAGRVWGSCFFIFMSFAALSTVIAVFENIVMMLQDGLDWSRSKAVKVNIIAVAILSLPAILGFNVLAGFEPLGSGTNIMDLEDFIVSYNILPLGSLMCVLFCTRKNGWGWDAFRAEANTGKGISLPNAVRGYMTYVVPSIIVVIYLKGYYDMFAPKGTKSLIIWMIVAVAIIVGLMSIVFGKTRVKEKEVVTLED